MTILITLKIIFRAIMEMGIIYSFARWGYWIGGSETQKIFLCIITPVLVFSFWGFFDFRKLVKNPEYFRLVQELIICALAILALSFSGYHTLAVLMGLISVSQYIILYSSGQKLIQKKK